MGREKRRRRHERKREINCGYLEADDGAFGACRDVVVAFEPCHDVPHSERVILSQWGSLGRCSCQNSRSGGSWDRAHTAHTAD